MAATVGERDTIGEATLGELESTLRGHLTRPADPDYDQARAVWNAAHDRRPALVIRCAGAADVIRSQRLEPGSNDDVHKHRGRRKASCPTTWPACSKSSPRRSPAVCSPCW